MKTETISGDIKTHGGVVRFKHETTPSDAYEKLTDAVYRKGLDPETEPDDTRLGTATLTVKARDDERLYTEGRVTSVSVELYDGEHARGG